MYLLNCVKYMYRWNLQKIQFNFHVMSICFTMPTPTRLVFWDRLSDNINKWFPKVNYCLTYYIQLGARQLWVKSFPKWVTRKDNQNTSIQTLGPKTTHSARLGLLRKPGLGFPTPSASSSMIPCFPRVSMACCKLSASNECWESAVSFPARFLDCCHTMSFCGCVFAVACRLRSSFITIFNPEIPCRSSL